MRIYPQLTSGLSALQAASMVDGLCLLFAWKLTFNNVNALAWSPFNFNLFVFFLSDKELRKKKAPQK